MKEQIKGFFGTMLGITLGGEAIRQAGSSSLGAFRDATQTAIGAGILSNTFRNFKLK